MESPARHSAPNVFSAGRIDELRSGSPVRRDRLQATACRRTALSRRTRIRMTALWRCWRDAQISTGREGTVVGTGSVYLQHGPRHRSTASGRQPRCMAPHPSPWPRKEGSSSRGPPLVWRISRQIPERETAPGEERSSLPARLLEDVRPDPRHRSSRCRTMSSRNCRLLTEAHPSSSQAQHQWRRSRRGGWLSSMTRPHLFRRHCEQRCCSRRSRSTSSAGTSTA